MPDDQHYQGAWTLKSSLTQDLVLMTQKHRAHESEPRPAHIYVEDAAVHISVHDDHDHRSLLSSPRLLHPELWSIGASHCPKPLTPFRFIATTSRYHARYPTPSSFSPTPSRTRQRQPCKPERIDVDATGYSSRSRLKARCCARTRDGTLIQIIYYVDSIQLESDSAQEYP